MLIGLQSVSMTFSDIQEIGVMDSREQIILMLVYMQQGCHGQGKVRKNYISFKVREKLGSFVSCQGISKSLFKISENDFIENH